MTNSFSYGWMNPVLAFALSTLGALLAILLTIKARARARRGRGRLLVYTNVALGGVAVFQAQLLALLGFGITGTVLHYDPLPLLLSLGFAVVAVSGGLCLLSFGRPGSVRLALSSTLIGVGIAGTNYIALDSIRGAGDLYYEPIRLLGSAALGILVGCAIVWFVVSVRGLRSAALAAALVGAGVCGTHYTAMSAIQTRPGLLRAVDGAAPATGYAPLVLLAPAVLLGAAVIAMLWFFSVGTSTVHDLRAIFEDPAHSVEIEPWMIAEVTRRATVGYRGPGPTGPVNEPRPVAASANAQLLPVDLTARNGERSLDKTAPTFNRYPPGFDHARRQNA